MRTINFREPLFVAGCALLGFLVLMACVFYVERTTGFDSAWQSFQMLLERFPRCEHRRYSTMITQLVPTLVLWCKGSLQSVLFAYSASLIAVHLLVFAVIAIRLRDGSAALAVPLALVVMVGGSFYFGVSEVQQGITAPLLAWALGRKALAAPRADLVRAWGSGAVVAAVWATLYHVVYALPVVYVLGLEIIGRKGWLRLRYWLLPLSMVCAIALCRLFVGMSDYERERMVDPGEFTQFASDLSVLPSAQYLLDALPRFPAMLGLMGVCAIVALLRLRWLSLLWTGGWTTLTVLLILITDRATYSPYMYENLYPLLGIAWAAFAADLTVGLVRGRAVMTAALVVVMVLGAWQVWRGRVTYVDKVQYAERITTDLRGQGVRKAIVSAHLIPWGYAQTHWTLPFETLLVSSMMAPDSAVTVFAEEPMDKAKPCMDDETRLLGPAWNICAFGLAQLDTALFQLPGGPYRIVSQLPDSAFRPQGTVRVAPLTAEFTMRSGDYDLLPVEVCWEGEVPLYALGTKALTTIHYEMRNRWSGWVEATGWTSLEMDLAPGACCALPLKVDRPARAGEHHLYLQLKVNEETLATAGPVTIRVHSFGI
ncbi:MAG: hypothetical protein IPJ76_08130 [Flavobacteriales bacterium]|nr:MAG: hypothetical protein IPJ76_08130 [Flavobacteriales bacterium]